MKAVAWPAPRRTADGAKLGAQQRKIQLDLH